MDIGADYIQAILDSGREPDPEDLPPALDWEAPIWDLYETIHTQWRVGMGGVTGLDYNPAIALINANGLRLQAALDLLRAIEQGFMEAWAARKGG